VAAWYVATHHVHAFEYIAARSLCLKAAESLTEQTALSALQHECMKCGWIDESSNQVSSCPNCPEGWWLKRSAEHAESVAGSLSKKAHHPPRLVRRQSGRQTSTLR
jgi:hypothetical protein